MLSGDSQKKSSVDAAKISSAVCEAHWSKGGVVAATSSKTFKLSRKSTGEEGDEQDEEWGEGNEDIAEEMKFEDSAERAICNGERESPSPEPAADFERLVMRLAGDTETGMEVIFLGALRFSSVVRVMESLEALWRSLKELMIGVEEVVWDFLEIVAFEEAAELAAFLTFVVFGLVVGLVVGFDFLAAFGFDVGLAADDDADAAAHDRVGAPRSKPDFNKLFFPEPVGAEAMGEGLGSNGRKEGLMETYLVWFLAGVAITGAAEEDMEGFAGTEDAAETVVEWFALGTYFSPSAGRAIADSDTEHSGTLLLENFSDEGDDERISIVNRNQSRKSWACFKWQQFEGLWLFQ